MSGPASDAAEYLRCLRQYLPNRRLASEFPDLHYLLGKYAAALDAAADGPIECTPGPGILCPACNPIDPDVFSPVAAAADGREAGRCCDKPYPTMCWNCGKAWPPPARE